MQAVRLVIYFILLIVVLTLGAFLYAVASAQSIDPDIRPDIKRALAAQQPSGAGRKNAYQSMRTNRVREERPRSENTRSAVPQPARVSSGDMNVPATTAIGAGTHLSRLLHTSQLSLSSDAGTDEQFVDRNGDLVADERTTFDSAGGSFDIAVGQSGARYEVYSATPSNTLVGVLVVALDTNGDYVANTSSTLDLQRDFHLPSAAAVVTGTSKAGREFVIVSSSGYYNTADPNDPKNESSPGVLLLVRDPNTNGFDDSRTRELVKVGDNRLYNANALALMPNNDLLVADFHSDELRIVRDTDADGIPDTLDNTPYYSYRFSDDAPLDIAVNSRGVVFSHSAGNDTVMLAIYDDNADGRGDRDEVVVEGLSIDNNLFLHGLTVDRKGSVYVIEDASASFDGSAGNGGQARIDAFPDGGMNGFLSDGSIFSQADSGSLALSGLSFAVVSNQINDAQYFVRQHYLDFLGREPDTGGLGYWSGQIGDCGLNDPCIRSRRTGVSAAFFIELEFQDTGGFVYRIYKSSLARRPTFAEFVADRSRVVPGANVEASKQAFADEWVQRSVFLQSYPLTQTPEQFVNKLFDMAGLIPFTTERQNLVDDLRNGKTRGKALREVVEITDFRTREYNPAFVLMQYFGYLQRDPDQGGYDFWLNVLNNREPNNYRGMVCSFITSREYQERFGLLLRRSNTDCAE
jgi:hypothetical protein